MRRVGALSLQRDSLALSALALRSSTSTGGSFRQPNNKGSASQPPPLSTSTGGLGQLKGLGSEIAKSFQKDFTTAQCAAQSTASVAAKLKSRVSGGEVADSGEAATCSVGDTSAATTGNASLNVLGKKPLKASRTDNLSVHREHCVLGWSPEQIYTVVADVAQYQAFLPWCVSSSVESVDSEDLATAREMTATLGVGFSFFREKYTSQVVLDPKFGIHAELRGKSTLLRELHCNWCFGAARREDLPVGVNPAKCADVSFDVRFEFRNPLHQSMSTLVMSNVVTVMTSSFEKRCEALYGPPSIPRKALPLVGDADDATFSTATLDRRQQGTKSTATPLDVATTR